jgi:hypothetical protein
MYYVEFLRVSRALLVAMAWLAVPLAINLIILGSHVGGASLGSVPLTTVFAIAGIAASVFATSIGGSLACENEGHLPFALTKPASRFRQASTKLAVGIGAVIAFFAIVCAGLYGVDALLGVTSFFSIQSDTWLQLVRFVLAPIAVYGLMQALSASLNSQVGTVFGAAWGGLVCLAALGAAPLPGPIHTIVSILNVANPVVYIGFDFGQSDATVSIHFAAAIAALALVATTGVAAAIFQWQRVEA